MCRRVVELGFIGARMGSGCVAAQSVGGGATVGAVAAAGSDAGSRKSVHTNLSDAGMWSDRSEARLPPGRCESCRRSNPCHWYQPLERRGLQHRGWLDQPEPHASDQGIDPSPAAQREKSGPPVHRSIRPWCRSRVQEIQCAFQASEELCHFSAINDQRGHHPHHFGSRRHEQ